MVQLLNLLKNYILKTLGIIIPIATLGLLYKFLGFEKFLELSKIFLWPTVIIIGMMFFRKVIFYLFFSLEEFNFFGNRGKLKDVTSLIEEKVLKKLQEEKESQERIHESNALKNQLKEVQGNAAQLFIFANKAVEKNQELTKVIQEKEKRIESLSSTAIRVGQLVSVQEPNNRYPTVYYVGDGVLLGIPDLATFNSWGFSFDQVLPANKIEKYLPRGGGIPMKLKNYSSPLDQLANEVITQPKL